MYKSGKHNLLQLQKASILEMLRASSGNVWKVLIYDSQGKDIIAPLFKVCHMSSNYILHNNHDYGVLLHEYHIGWGFEATGNNT